MCEEETQECPHLTLWSESQREVHCHTAKPEQNQWVYNRPSPFVSTIQDKYLSALSDKSMLVLWYVGKHYNMAYMTCNISNTKSVTAK